MFKNTNSKKMTGILLALVLVTSLFIGGSIARYVTSTSSEDEARVAVWGINADDVTMDLFNTTYELPDGTVVAQSNDGDNIIAPGTSKDNYFSIVNTDDNLAPEVMYEVRINLDDSEIDPLILNNPSIQWRLDDNSYGTWEETKAQVLALSGHESGVKTYAPGELADEFKAGVTHTIGWTWLMDNNNDEMDTEMGNAAVDGDIVAKIVVNVTAVQTNVDSTGMLEGNGSVYDINNPTTLTFRSSAPLSELQSVKVGDDTLTQGTDYTATEGSTVITLSEDYLTTLEKGNYIISIISTSMTTKASFSVEEKTIANPLVHNGIIPQNATYYKGLIKSNEVGFEPLDGSSQYETILTTGDSFPEPQLGDSYVYGDYRYMFGYQSQSPSNITTPSNTPDGWGVIFIGNVDANGKVENILEKIANKPIKNLNYTFTNVDSMNHHTQNLIVAPKIPDTVTQMDSTFQMCSNLTTITNLPSNVENLYFTFQYCSSLETVPTIPNTAKNMYATFMGCSALTGNIEINAQNITEYTGTFLQTEKPILLTGTSPYLEEIASEYNNVFFSSSQIISFTIDEDQYSCEIGMTWKEFINSSYNVGNLVEQVGETIMSKGKDVYNGELTPPCPTPDSVILPIHYGLT